MLTVRDANRQLELALPEDETYTTIAGFLMAEAGRVLHAGEKVETNAGVFLLSESIIAASDKFDSCDLLGRLNRYERPRPSLLTSLLMESAGALETSIPYVI
jgi:hypothetical protein